MVKLVSTFLMLGIAIEAQAVDVAGRYYLEGVREVGSEMLVKPNGTFEFMFAYGAADYWGKGTWRVDGDALVLTSDGGERKPPFRLARSSAETGAGVRVRVVTAKGNHVPDIDVRVTTANGAIVGRTYSDGVASFGEAAGVKSVEFQIPMFEFETGPLTVNPKHNDFTFEINGESINEAQFKSERLTISAGSVTMHQWMGHPLEMKYVKH